MEPKYEEDFTVYRHDGDFRQRATPGALLRYAQQIAVDNSESLGLTRAVHARNHTAYVLAKLAMHITRLPAADEVITAVTMPERARHAVNKRVTLLRDAAGQELACIDSRWVLIDTGKRTILRTHAEEYEAGCAQEVARELPLRIHKPDAALLEPLGECCASYSRCDENAHMNNTRYADIVCDALPSEVWQSAEAEDLIIFYHRELPLGQSCTLYRAETEPGHWYVCGMREGRACFEASVTLRAAEP